MIVLFNMAYLSFSSELKIWDRFIHLKLSTYSYVLPKLNIRVSLKGHLKEQVDCMESPQCIAASHKRLPNSSFHGSWIWINFDKLTSSYLFESSQAYNGSVLGQYIVWLDLNVWVNAQELSGLCRIQNTFSLVTYQGGFGMSCWVVKWQGERYWSKYHIVRCIHQPGKMR